MPRQTIETRVLALDERVTELERLPDRIDHLTSQASQFQAETRAEFSAMRRDMGHRFDAVEKTMHELHGIAMTKIDELGGQMRALHEDVIDRIAKIGEGSRRPPTRRTR